jgi:single-strand DNA-binding protein
MFDQVSLIQSKIVANILENNCVTLTGNVGDNKYNNLTLQTFEDGGCIINFTLATHYDRMDMGSGKVENITNWHKLTARGEIAKRISESVAESDYITVTGFLAQRQYTTKEGTNCIISEVHVIKFRILDKKVANPPPIYKPLNETNYTTHLAADGSIVYTGVDDKPVMTWKNITSNNAGSLINNQSGQKSFLDV